MPLTSSFPHSRVHQLKTFNSCSKVVNVKRDDELGFGVSGSKLRKYTSLIPFLLKNNYKEAIIIGSAYSNHVLGISQLLIENCIKPFLFLLGDPTRPKKGNLLLTSLLVPKSQIQWISRNQWPTVETIALNYLIEEHLKAKIIHEGACMDEALPGALTLAIDILLNEQENNEEFAHIFLDAGMGLGAIATILAYTWLNKKTILHVLLLADKERAFLIKLQQFQKSFERIFNVKLERERVASQFKLYLPTQAHSFGSVNKTTIDYIKFMAREEGFFLDPIYSAKLFLEAKKIIPTLDGNVLIVHSGGGLTLMGFQSQLSQN